MPGSSWPSRPIAPAVAVDLEVTAAGTAESTVESTTASTTAKGHEPGAVTCEPPPAASPVPGPTVPGRPRLRIVVFGPPRVFRVFADGDDAPVAARDPAPDRGGVDVTGAFQPRIRELLVFLGVHPRGATREAVIAALWPDSTPAQATNSVNTTLSRLRRAVRAVTDGAVEDVVLTGNGSYRLDPGVVQVDFAAFAHAQDARRAAGSAPARREAYQTMIDVYAGSLAEGMSAEWIEPVRESLRREALDAVAAEARALVSTDPDATLELLEVARVFDPYNELLYRDIMRLQARLGRVEAVGRTLALLTMRLAELDEQPTPEAVDLATRLSRRDDAGRQAS